ncbi:MAG: helix-turn-helix domain-containing protein [Mongoliitalea sp.]
MKQEPPIGGFFCGKNDCFWTCCNVNFVNYSQWMKRALHQLLMLHNFKICKFSHTFVTNFLNNTHMKQDQIIGKNMQAIRQKLGFTQKQVAAYLQINREEVSYYEIGSRTASTKILSQLANLYGVDEYDFFEENLDMANVNLALAFRAESINAKDLAQIAKFKKIVRNYLNMKNLHENEPTTS